MPNLRDFEIDATAPLTDAEPALIMGNMAADGDATTGGVGKWWQFSNAGTIVSQLSKAGAAAFVSVGLLTAGAQAALIKTPSTGAIDFRNAADSDYADIRGKAGTFSGALSAASATIASAGALGWSTDLFLVRDAANNLAQRNGTSAQAFRIYNTYTDASNYERLSIEWSGNAARILTQAAGTGSIRQLHLGAGGIFWVINSSGHFLTSIDNTYDIGASGATRPRTGYFATSILAPVHAISTDGGTLTFGASSDVVLARDAANTLAQRNGANAQVLHIYNTYTDVSNYERGYVRWNSNAFEITTFASGTGSQRAVRIGPAGSSNLELMTGSTTRFSVNTSGHFLAAADNTYDIGASGATRPRTAHIATSILLGSTTPTANFLGIGAGTTSKSQINLAASTAPTSPANGDIWFDGTDLKIRIAGVTKTFTVT